MKIVLSGGGSGEQTREIDELFANMINKDKPLLYIPIAIDNCKHPYLECLIWLKKTFDNLGISKYQMVVEGDLKTVANEDPLSFGGIYIGGGNTFYLLKKLKESSLWGFIKKAVEKDIPIYGGSAGAIIFSKSIISSILSDRNWVELKDFEGLNLIQNHYLFCHYKREDEQRIKSFVKKEKVYPAIVLPETTGLYIGSGGIEIIGKEKAILFDKGGNKKDIAIRERLI